MTIIDDMKSAETTIANAATTSVSEASEFIKAKIAENEAHIAAFESVATQAVAKARQLRIANDNLGRVDLVFVPVAVVEAPVGP